MMWPYSNDERVWLVPSKEWAEKLPLTSDGKIPVPANDLSNGAWPYATAEQVAEDNRPFDPKTFVAK